MYKDNERAKQSDLKGHSEADLLAEEVFQQSQIQDDGLGSRCGLISLDSSGGGAGAIPSTSTTITGWFGSLCAQLTVSLHLLKSFSPLIWNTIWALSGICLSVSGWVSTYLLNSAESVRCSVQKSSSFIIFIAIMLMTFSAVRSIGKEITFGFDIHSINIPI